MMEPPLETDPGVTDLQAAFLAQVGDERFDHIHAQRQDWAGAEWAFERPAHQTPGNIVVRNTFIDVCPVEEDSQSEGNSLCASPFRKNISAPPSPSRRNPWREKAASEADSDHELEDDPGAIPTYEAAPDGGLIHADHHEGKDGGAVWTELRGGEEAWAAKPPSIPNWLKAPPGSPQKVRPKNSSDTMKRPSLADFSLDDPQASALGLGGLGHYGAGGLGGTFSTSLGFGQVPDIDALTGGQLPGYDSGCFGSGLGGLDLAGLHNLGLGQSLSLDPALVAPLEGNAAQDSLMNFRLNQILGNEHLSTGPPPPPPDAPALSHADMGMYGAEHHRASLGAQSFASEMAAYDQLMQDHVLSSQPLPGSVDASRRHLQSRLALDSNSIVAAASRGAFPPNDPYGVQAALEGVANAQAIAQAAQAAAAQAQAAQAAQAAKAAHAAQIAQSAAAQAATAQAAAAAYPNRISHEGILALQQTYGQAAIASALSSLGYPSTLPNVTSTSNLPNMASAPTPPPLHSADLSAYAPAGIPPAPPATMATVPDSRTSRPDRRGSNRSSDAGSAHAQGQPWVAAGALTQGQNAPWVMPGSRGAAKEDSKAEAKAGAPDSKGRIPLSGGGPKRTDYLKKYGGAAEAAEETQAATTPITTMMLKNIPCRKGQEEVMGHIDQKGFQNRYDFFYLPRDVKFRANLGYAFINFITPEDAARFEKEMNGYRFNGSGSTKACQIVPAHVQGLMNNLAAFKRTEVMRSSRKPYFSGVVVL